MKVVSLSSRVLLLAFVLAGARVSAEEVSVIVLSLPGVVTLPKRGLYGEQLIRGTWRGVDQNGRAALVDPVLSLSEAVFACGQRRFQWRGLNSDHGKELLIANHRAIKRALQCIARKVPFDFYVRAERIDVR